MATAKPVQSSYVKLVSCCLYWGTSFTHSSVTMMPQCCKPVFPTLWYPGIICYSCCHILPTWISSHFATFAGVMGTWGLFSKALKILKLNKNSSKHYLVDIVSSSWHQRMLKHTYFTLWNEWKLAAKKYTLFIFVGPAHSSQVTAVKSSFYVICSSGNCSEASLISPSHLQIYPNVRGWIVMLKPFFFFSFLFCFPKIRDEPIQMKPLSWTNGGQPFPSSTSTCSAPSSPSHPVTAPTRPGLALPSVALTSSPTHKPQGGGVRKVTGVGGTTYEISVWVGSRPPHWGPGRPSGHSTVSEGKIWNHFVRISHLIGC